MRDPFFTVDTLRRFLMLATVAAILIVIALLIFPTSPRG